MRQHRIAHPGRAEQENPGVPAVTARGEHRFGIGQRRLFDEAFDREAIVSYRRSTGDIAEACFGMGRRDAEGDEITRGDRRHAVRHRRAKGRGVRHHMVGRRDEHDRLGVFAQQPERGGEHGGAGVAPRRLDQDRAGVDSGLGQLLGDDEAEIRVGQHHRRVEIEPTTLAREAPRRGLEQAFVADEPRELLGIALSGQWPEPRARAATQENGSDAHQFDPPDAGSPAAPVWAARLGRTST